MPTVDNYTISVTLDLRNRKDIQQFQRDLQRTAGALPQAQRQLQTTAKSFSGLQRNVQNASFQITDFIVQIQSGQSASRAFAQQAPQLLAGFGALGAALGVVAAILPTVIKQFTDLGDSTETLVKDITALDDAVGSIGRSVNTLSLDSWIREFNEATAAEREFLIQTLETDRILAERARRTALEGPREILGDLGRTRGLGATGRPGEAARRAAARREEEAAESLGINVETLRQVQPLYEKLIATRGQDQQVIIELRSQLAAYDQTLETSNENLNTQLDLLNSLFSAGQATAETTRALATATAAGAEGVAATSDATLQLVDARGKLVENTRALSQAELELAERFAEDQELFTEATNNQIEQFDLLAESADLLNRTFSGAFDGVLRGTQSVSDAFKNMARVILAEVAKLAVLQGLARLFPGNVIGQSATRLLGNAQGNAFAGGNVVPMARGGIVNGPTIFPMARGAGLMGEAGPEAVLPLKRTSSGDLGVQANPLAVTINNMAPGVSVQQRPGGDGLTLDIVLDSVANSIARGGNAVSTAIEDSYSLGRGRGVY